MIDDSTTTALLTEAEAERLAALLLGPATDAPVAIETESQPDASRSSSLFGGTPTKQRSPGRTRPSGGSLFGNVIDLREEPRSTRTAATASLFGPSKAAPTSPISVGALFPPKPASSGPDAAPTTASPIVLSLPRTEPSVADHGERVRTKLVLPADPRPVGFIPADPALPVEIDGVRRFGRGRLLAAMSLIVALVVGGLAVSALTGSDGTETRSSGTSVPATVPSTVPTTVVATTQATAAETIVAPAETTAPTTVPVVDTTAPVVTAAAPLPQPRRTPTTVRRRATTTTVSSPASETVAPEPSATFAPPTWMAEPSPAAPPAPPAPTPTTTATTATTASTTATTASPTTATAAQTPGSSGSNPPVKETPDDD